MKAHLQRQLLRLDQQRNRLLERLDAFTPAQLAYQPAPTSWSMAGVVQHLVLVEEGVVRTARRMADSIPSRSSLGVQLRYRVLIGIMHSGIRVQSPVPTIIPIGHISPADLRPRWDAARRALAEYVEERTQGEPGRPAFRHPRTGWISVAQGLRFIEAHCDHHLRQIDRIRRAEGFPDQSANATIWT